MLAGIPMPNVAPQRIATHVTPKKLLMSIVKGMIEATAPEAIQTFKKRRFADPLGKNAPIRAAVAVVTAVVIRIRRFSSELRLDVVFSNTMDDMKNQINPPETRINTERKLFQLNPRSGRKIRCKLAVGIVYFHVLLLQIKPSTRSFSAVAFWNRKVFKVQVYNTYTGEEHEESFAKTR